MSFTMPGVMELRDGQCRTFLTGQDLAEEVTKYMGYEAGEFVGSLVSLVDALETENDELYENLEKEQEEMEKLKNERNMLLLDICTRLRDALETLSDAEDYQRDGDERRAGECLVAAIYGLKDLKRFVRRKRTKNDTSGLKS